MTNWIPFAHPRLHSIYTVMMYIERNTTTINHTFCCNNHNDNNNNNNKNGNSNSNKCEINE